MWLNNENKNSKEHYEKVRNYFRGRVKDNGTTDGRKTGASEAISGNSPTGINERGGTRVGQAEQGKEGRAEVDPTAEDIAKANEGVDFEGLFGYRSDRNRKRKETNSIIDKATSILSGMPISYARGLRNESEKKRASKNTTKACMAGWAGSCLNRL